MAKVPKQGDRVKVVANSNKHNYKIGQVYIVGVVYQTGDHRCQFRGYNPATQFIGNYLKAQDVEIVPLSQEHFRAECERLRQELQQAADALMFLEQNNLDKISEQQLAAYQALSILDNKDTSMLERTERLAMLVKHLQQ